MSRFDRMLEEASVHRDEHFCRLMYSDFLERETFIGPQKVNIYISREMGRGVNRGGKSRVDFNPMRDLLGHGVPLNSSVRFRPKS